MAGLVRAKRDGTRAAPVFPGVAQGGWEAGPGTPWAVLIAPTAVEVSPVAESPAGGTFGSAGACQRRRTLRLTPPGCSQPMWSMKRRSPGGGPVPGDVVIDRLEEHPNLPAILGVLAQLPHIADADLSRLAGVRGETRNTVSVAEARQRALSAVFEVISALFADDIAGGPNYIENDPTV